VDVVRTLAIFLVAAAAELGGTYAVWRWRRAGAGAAALVGGAALLLAYALVQTFQPEDRYGRVYAAYAGVFLMGAMLWGWAVGGARPDRFDLLGGGLVLLGAATILWGRRAFG
jgi:small multidrug resistance family-3 protein